MELHEEDEEVLVEALKTYQKTKSASRKRKAARKAGLSPMDEESTLPVTFEITDEEVPEERTAEGPRLRTSIDGRRR